MVMGLIKGPRCEKSPGIVNNDKSVHSHGGPRLMLRQV